MDSEKPKPDAPSGSRSGSDSARRRVERLSRTGSEERDPSSTPAEPGDDADSGSPAPSPGSGSPSRRADSSPRLTERQRIEAREQRRNERRGRDRGRGASSKGRGKSAQGGSEGPTGNPLSRGVRATWLEVRRTAGFLWGLILSGLERLGPALRFVAAGLLALLAAVGVGIGRLGRAAGAVLSRIGTLLLALDRVLTPRRALIAVAGGAVLALIASQFTDFRATEIGQAGYDPILDITRAPRTDVLTPTGAHSILLLLVAGAAIAAIAGVTLTGKRFFAAAIALAGAATIAVSLLIDLPRGLDVAEAEISYSEVAAVLLSGFWIQLGAGLVLAIGGLGLLMLSGARRRDKDSRSAAGRGATDRDAAGSSADLRQDRGPRGDSRSRPADAGGIS